MEVMCDTVCEQNVNITNVSNGPNTLKRNLHRLLSIGVRRAERGHLVKHHVFKKATELLGYNCVNMESCGSTRGDTVFSVTQEVKVKGQILK